MTFERYDAVGTHYPTMTEKRRELERTPLPVNTFARSAVATALDALMTPVTLPAKIAQRAGYPNKAAELSGAEALADVESLYRNETTPESRERIALGERAHPNAAGAGSLAGEAIAAGVTAGALKASPAVRAEAARAFGGTRASQRGAVDIPVTGEQMTAALEKQKSGMRPESLEHLRKGGEVRGGPVRIESYPDTGPTIGNGRHRMTVARERGEPYVTGDYVEYDAEGNVKRKLSGVKIPTGAK